MRTAVPQLVPGVIDEFIQARHVWPRSIEAIRHFGLHTPEGPEMPRFARNLGRYFATTDRVASTHFGTDSELTVRYADDNQTCAAAKGINTSGIHVEIAGVAAQTDEQWNDEFSVAALGRTARLFRLYHEGHYQIEIPAVLLSAAELSAGKAGIVTHATAWQVYGGDFRSDPGDNFPDELFLAMCRGEEETRVAELSDLEKIRQAYNQGDRSAVAFVQTALVRASRVMDNDRLHPGNTDGNLGPRTRRALAVAGINDPVDKIGPKGWGMLLGLGFGHTCPDRVPSSAEITRLTEQVAQLTARATQAEDLARALGQRLEKKDAEIDVAGRAVARAADA